MYSILDRYVGKILICNIVIVLFVLISLSSVIKFVDELRKVGQGNYSVCKVGIYVFLDMIKDIELFLPVAILLGALLGLGILSVRNELIIIEVFGFSRLQIMYSLVKTAIPVILCTILINEWISPVSERLAKDYRYKMINGVSMDSEYRNIWIKDGRDFIYIERVVHFDQLLGVHIYNFDSNRKLLAFRYAISAEFVNGSWFLLDVNKLSFRNFSYVFKEHCINDLWTTSIKPHHLLTVVRSLYYSGSLSVVDLYRCIHFFKQHGQNILQYQFRFWKKVFFPISVISMMLVALSCILRSLLNKLHIGMQLLLGIVYSFFFIF